MPGDIVISISEGIDASSKTTKNGQAGNVSGIRCSHQHTKLLRQSFRQSRNRYQHQFRRRLRPVPHRRRIGHVAVRHVRRDGLDLLKKREKKGEISEDQHRRFEKDVQALTDDEIKKIDGLLAYKEKEILQV